MYAKTPDGYFPTGALALRQVRLAMLQARKPTCESILDFACGYGRAMRYFRAAFPDAKLTACDITRDAVDFCAQEFDATPVYSQEDPAAIDLPGPFDVIWVGSLFTHVPQDRWIEFLDLLESVLADAGAAGVHRAGPPRPAAAPVGRARVGTSTTRRSNEIVRAYDETGYGYADWSGARTTARR